VIPIFLFGLSLFSLSADHLCFKLGTANVKLGYFLILGFALFNFGAVLRSAKLIWNRLPKWHLVSLAFLIISILLSNNLLQSLFWMAWLGLGMLTLVSTHAYLKTYAFDEAMIRKSAFVGLGLIALFGMIQFVSIYFLKHIIFEPQFQAYFFRINGISGWPHFLNIFSFLILPFALTGKKLSWPERSILIVLMFVLIESTSKTGWVLFFGLTVSALIFNREVFVSHFLKFLIPVTVMLTFVPTPHLEHMPNTTSGADRMALIAQDLRAGAGTSGQDRILINKMGLAVWEKHPLFGVGPRAYGTYVQSKFDEELPGVNKLDALHEVNLRNENIWIELLAENGALFTFLIAISIFSTLLPPNSIRKAWAPSTSLLLYYAISGQFSQSILITLVFMIWGIYIYTRTEVA